MVYLELIMGPMFSGKSTKLIEYITNHRNESSVKQLIINHVSDNRYSEDRSIVTHTYEMMPCKAVSNLSEILGIQEFMEADNIYIDEAQFFPDLYNSIVKIMLHSDKNIYISGLDSDFMMKTFPNLGILSLIPLANKITKLYSRCYICQCNASYTMRTTNNNSQILVGSTNDYQPVCFRHHNKLEHLEMV